MGTLCVTRIATIRADFICDACNRACIAVMKADLTLAELERVLIELNQMKQPPVLLYCPV